MEGQLQYMINKGFEVHLILPRDTYFTPEIKKRDSNVILHHVSLKRNISLINDLKSFIQIMYLLLKLKPSILHLHTPKASFIGALAAKFIFQKNVIYQMHGLVSTNGTKVNKSLIYYLEKYTCALVDSVYAVSFSLRDFAIKNNYCIATKIKVIGNGSINGINCESKFNRNKLNNPDKYLNVELIDGRFVIGYIGRFSREKGIFDFLEVVSIISQSHSILVVLVGSNETGEDFSELLKNFPSLDSSNLKVFNEISDPENVMHHFNILLFPSKREGFGLVAAEANALEVPVVAYNIPGVKDAIENNVSGKLVPYGNIDALVKSVVGYMEDSGQLEEHGKNGKKRVKELFNRLKLWELIYMEYTAWLEK